MANNNSTVNIFQYKMLLLEKLDQKGILEIAYEGNIGLHELVNFYMKANEDQVERLEYFLKTSQIPLAVDLIELVTGTRLVMP
jgi:hypothetical protein